MTETNPDRNASSEELLESIFNEMVLQLADMAITLCGRIPMPDGETLMDLESAKKVIDQLEALQYKTRGNLTSKQELLLAEYLQRARREFASAMEAQSSE